VTGVREVPYRTADDQRRHPGLTIPLSLAAWMAVVLLIDLIARCL